MKAGLIQVRSPVSLGVPPTLNTSHWLFFIVHCITIGSAVSVAAEYIANVVVICAIGWHCEEVCCCSMNADQHGLFMIQLLLLQLVPIGVRESLVWFGFSNTLGDRLICVARMWDISNEWEWIGVTVCRWMCPQAKKGQRCNQREAGRSDCLNRLSIDFYV